MAALRALASLRSSFSPYTASAYIPPSCKQPLHNGFSSTTCPPAMAAVYQSQGAPDQVIKSVSPPWTKMQTRIKRTIFSSCSSFGNYWLQEANPIRLSFCVSAFAMWKREDVILHSLTWPQAFPFGAKIRTQLTQFSIFFSSFMLALSGPRTEVRLLLFISHCNLSSEKSKEQPQLWLSVRNHIGPSVKLWIIFCWSMGSSTWKVRKVSSETMSRVRYSTWWSFKSLG